MHAWLALLALLFALLSTLIAKRWRASRKARRRAARASAGEERAETTLRLAGFSIIDRQATERWTILCDGEPLQITLRADYLVERDGCVFVAEVKTGDEAPRLENTSTRRQLLEYLLAYGADGVLLVDVEADAIFEVEFPGYATETTETSVAVGAAVVLSFAVGAAGGAVMSLWLG